MSEKKGLLVNNSFSFAIRIINLYKFLTTEKREFVLSKQILRSGTSIGALIREAQNAESKPDFIHKLGIAQKECDETSYWLELLYETEYINKDLFDSYQSETLSLLKMLRSAIITTKKTLHTK